MTINVIIDEFLKQLRLTSWVEAVGAVTGLLCVGYAILNRPATWYWGLVSVLAYGWVFWESKLYSNMGLQLLYFVPMQFYGWWAWSARKNAPVLPVTKLSNRARVAWVIGTIVASGALGFGMTHTGAAQAYVDAFATGASVSAQYLQARRVYENWIAWIVIDAVSAFYLFPVQKLYFTTALYVVFLVLAFLGDKEWRGLLKTQAVAEAA